MKLDLNDLARVATGGRQLYGDQVYVDIGGAVREVVVLALIERIRELEACTTGTVDFLQDEGFDQLAKTIRDRLARGAVLPDPVVTGLL